MPEFGSHKMQNKLQMISIYEYKLRQKVLLFTVNKLIKLKNTSF
jgi:hypothetical protein